MSARSLEPYLYFTWNRKVTLGHSYISQNTSYANTEKKWKQVLNLKFSGSLLQYRIQLEPILFCQSQLWSTKKNKRFKWIIFFFLFRLTVLYFPVKIQFGLIFHFERQEPTVLLRSQGWVSGRIMHIIFLLQESGQKVLPYVCMVLTMRGEGEYKFNALYFTFTYFQKMTEFASVYPMDIYSNTTPKFKRERKRRSQTCNVN